MASVLERFDRLVQDLVDQQAIPDDSWRVEYAAIRSTLTEQPSAPAERERIARAFADLRAEVMTLVSDPNLTWNKARPRLREALNAALDAAAQGGE